MGKKDRELIARGFVDVNRLVNVSFFWMDVSNPFPWVSGSWPVTGPAAFTGREPDRVGVTVTRTHAVNTAKDPRHPGEPTNRCMHALRPRRRSPGAIYLGTLAALAVVATLSVVIYRSAVRDTVAQHSSAAAGDGAHRRGRRAGRDPGDCRRGCASSAACRACRISTSRFLGPRVEAAFGDNPNGLVRSDRPRRSREGRSTTGRRTASCIGTRRGGYRDARALAVGVGSAPIAAT